ncbi:MAG: peptidase [Cyanobacteria bacterium RYN_339]|nr:peptidase [Cyanobacteria bacterium RYN_339]
MKKTLAIVALPLALVLGGAIQLGRPVPTVELGGAPGAVTLPGKFTVTFPTQGQAAVGEQSLGLVAATPNQEAVPIASLAKMMTAYLLLKAQPLEVGQDGPTTTITAADVLEYEHDRAAGYSVAKVAAGEKLTERQLLEALLLPSADNVATLIARQVGGTEAGFVKKMNEAAHALGMDHTTYTDASGVNAATASTASDQLRIAQVVMRDRTMREVVRMPQAALPVAGVVYNVNFMVGKEGLSGVKTGSTLAAGSCFVGSFPVTVDGKPRLLLGAVLGQKSLREALSYEGTMLHAVAPQFKVYPLPAPQAHLSTPWQAPVALKPAAPLKVFGFPGMSVNVATQLTHATLPIAAGQTVGTLAITAGEATEAIELRATGAIQAPSLMWRLGRMGSASASPAR